MISVHNPILILGTSFAWKTNEIILVLKLKLRVLRLEKSVTNQKHFAPQVISFYTFFTDNSFKNNISVVFE